MTKREFLGACGTIAALTIAQPAAGWAQETNPPRILGGPPPRDRGVGGRKSPELERLVESVRVGARTSHRGLHVFWLYGVVEPGPLPIATLEEARDRGDLLISERERATVPSLVVDNRGKRHVLLLAGEILVGGKQNRVVTEDVLLRPRSGPIDLQVYCVEQGRWHGASRGFGGRAAFAAPQLRSTVVEGRSQSDVWAQVQRYARSAAAPSPTQNYEAIYDKPEVSAHQAETERAIDMRVTAPGALGAAVFAGSAFTGLDLFQDGPLFGREWPKLLRAQALEIYDRPSSKDVDEAVLRAQIETLLRRARSVEGSLRRGADAGSLFEFRVDRSHGSVLLAEGRVVHAALL